MISLCSSANSMKRSPFPFLSPIPNAPRPMLLKYSFVLVPVFVVVVDFFALKAPVMILCVECDTDYMI